MLKCSYDALNGIFAKISENAKLYLPADKDGKTEYQETFHPVSGEARKALNDAVLEAYEQKLAEEQTEDEALDEEQTEDQSFTQTM